MERYIVENCFRCVVPICYRNRVLMLVKMWNGLQSIKLRLSFGSLKIVNVIDVLNASSTKVCVFRDVYKSVFARSEFKWYVKI